MRLHWNPSLRRFEAEFHNFAEDQPRVKDAGFKTDGPPGWIWYSTKAAPLAKLKGTPGLTISPEARAEFNALLAMELRNEEVKKAAQQAKKALKKKIDADKQDKMKPDEYLDEELGFVCLKVSPQAAPEVSSLNAPKLAATEKCVICGCCLFDYEFNPESIKACLWCQKIVLDNSEEVV